MMHRKKSMTCAILLGMMSMSVPNVAGRQQLMPVYHKLNAEARREVEPYIEEVIKEVVKDPSKTLNPSETSIDAIDDLSNEKDESMNAIKSWIKTKFNEDSDQVGLVILLENYSNYKFVHPIHSETHDCSAQRVMIKPGVIGPGEYGVIAFDNGGYAHYDSCNSLSWQIHGPDNLPLRESETNIGRRLNVIYETYWKGACSLSSAKRGDGYRVLVIPNKLDKQHKWTSEGKKQQKNVKKNFLTKFLKRSIDGVETHDKVGNKYRFLVKSEYINPDFRNGCNPILRVQFMTTEKHGKHMNYGVSKSMSGEFWMWTYICIGLAVFAGVVALWVLYGRSKYKGSRNRANSYSKGQTKKATDYKWMPIDTASRKQHARNISRRQESDSEDQEPIKPIERSRMMQELHDGDESEEEYNQAVERRNQRTVERKVPL